jgi:hypothetical protein
MAEDSRMELTRAAGTHTVTAADYVLHVRDGQTVAELCDPAGRTWSRLSLLASLDRTDVADESYDLAAVEVRQSRVGDEDVVEVELPVASSAWTAKSVTLRCFADRLELSARVEGTGTLADVRLLGGWAVLAGGACGTFRSSIDFTSLFDPTPTEPVQVVRPAAAAATLGIVGDASPGRLHGIFSPPPLCLVLGREHAQHATDVPAGDWLALGVVAGIAEVHRAAVRAAGRRVPARARL